MMVKKLLYSMKIVYMKNHYRIHDIQEISVLLILSASWGQRK
jgi:hypothetical protein